MSRPFTVDLSDYYGQPDFREQDSSTIVDRRKMLNLHKKLDAGGVVSDKSRRSQATEAKPRVRGKRETGTTRTRKAGAMAFNNTDKSGGGTNCSIPGGALAFNEQQLMNELNRSQERWSIGYRCCHCHSCAHSNGTTDHIVNQGFVQG